MTEAGLKEDNTTNRAAWMKKINSNTGDPISWNKPGTKMEKSGSMSWSGKKWTLNAMNRQPKCVK